MVSILSLSNALWATQSVGLGPHAAPYPPTLVGRWIVCRGAKRVMPFVGAAMGEYVASNSWVLRHSICTQLSADLVRDLIAAFPKGL